MSAKKQKLVDLTTDEKSKVKRITLVSIAGVAVVCIILVGCFACTQDSGQPTVEMTDEQKVQYWTMNIVGVKWFPQTNESNDGVLKGLYIARDAKTVMDSESGKLLVYFMIDEDAHIGLAEIVLTSDEGSLLFVDDDTWYVKFSEKNDIKYMTIRDSDNKTVYYQQK